MFRDELESAFDERPIVYLTYGLCEPHGPHNALGMDALRPHAAACLAAREHGGIVAPPVCWHVHEQGAEGAWAWSRIGEARPWLTAVPVWVFLRNMCYHIRAADALGFNGAVIYSGHAGPFTKDIDTVLEILRPHVAMRVAVLIGVGATCRFPDGKGMGGHSGRGETSVLWATNPDCVDLSRLPAPGAPGPHFALGQYAGEANRKLGELMVADIVKRLGEMATQLLAEYAKAKPERKPLTFDDVERIWQEQIRPLIPDFACMRDLGAKQEPPPDDSRWHANWRVRYRG
jgi:creatinine amidohydrolase